MPKSEGDFIEQRDGHEYRMVTPVVGKHGNNACHNQRTHPNWILNPIKLIMLHAFEKRINDIGNINQCKNAEEPFAPGNEIIPIASIFLHAVWKEQRTQ